VYGCAKFGIGLNNPSLLILPKPFVMLDLTFLKDWLGLKADLKVYSALSPLNR